MKSFSLSAFGGGILASSYYYIYVMLQTPAGLLIDRFGPRRLLSLGALICAFGCLLFGSAHLLIWAIIGRLLMGFGAAFAFVGSLNVIAKWFPPKRFVLMAAVAETIGMSGTLVGGFFSRFRSMHGLALLDDWSCSYCIYHCWACLDDCP
ncbi:MFS transporter [Coxiella-like endosymbiont]|uniref:MFS transporter n=1 Tax=Coxiella-like endosymbiont TaxID=1592897 RepID=UPI002868E387|nr:MFS transporter [Coxiella-like endosymbiont]